MFYFAAGEAFSYAPVVNNNHMVDSLPSSHHPSNNTNQLPQQPPAPAYSSSSYGGNTNYTVSYSNAHHHPQYNGPPQQQTHPQHQQQQPSPTMYSHTHTPVSAAAGSNLQPAPQQQPQQDTLPKHIPSYLVHTPSDAPAVQEVVVYEPDLNKKPVRSAMKGAKSKEQFQKQLEQKLQVRNSLSLQRNSQSEEMGWQQGGGSLSRAAGDTPKARPRVAPKPGSWVGDFLAYLVWKLISFEHWTHLLYLKSN